jgi:hypothetical protein
MRANNRISQIFLIVCIIVFTIFGYSIAAENEKSLVQQKIEDASKLFEIGKVDAAIYKLQQVHKNYPKNVEVLFKLGKMAISAKNWAYSIYVLDKAAKLKPKDVEIRLVLAEIYRAYQQPIQEIITLREIVAIDAHNLVALKKLAHLYHEQNMQRDEEKTRRIIAKLDPSDYENLNNLSLLQAKKGAIFEEIITREKIQEKFPDKIDNEVKLARSYGLEGELYSQLNLLNKLRRDPRTKSPEIQNEYEKVEKAYKKAFSLYDGAKLDSVYFKDESDFDEITSYSGRIGYQKLLHTQYSDIEAFVSYHYTEYRPTSQLTGQKDINDYSGGIIYQYRWRKAKTRLKIMGGGQKVDVSGTVTPLVAGLNPVEFPWLENRDFGGTEPIGSLELEKGIGQNFGAGLHLDHVLLEDLDALVRMYTHDSAGINVYYKSRTGTRIDASYYYGRITGDGDTTDGNNRQKARLEFFYPVFVSGSIYGYAGSRTGYLKPIPKRELNFKYEFEFIRDDDPSPYYQSYTGSGELIHYFTLSGRHKLFKDLYLNLEGTYGTGKVVEKYGYAKGGLAYEDAFTNNRIELAYFYQTEEVVDQVNLTLTGTSDRSGIMLSVFWHF